MSGRLKLNRVTDNGRLYAVTFRGKQVGEIWRRRNERSSIYGRPPWECAAWLAGNGVVHEEDGFVRRGDAKRWVLQHQTEVPA